MKIEMVAFVTALRLPLQWECDCNYDANLFPNTKRQVMISLLYYSNNVHQLTARLSNSRMLSYNRWRYKLLKQKINQLCK